MKALADFHIHPNYSIDASGTIRQYCDRALEIGLYSICFTTHYDANPRRVEQDGYWKYKDRRTRMSDELLESYLKEIERAQAYFRPFGLHVYRGIEMDYFPGVESEAERIRGLFDFDFIIGSAHCLDDIAISDKREAPTYFAHKSLSRMADDYFALLQEAASYPGFDSLGHLDYYVRYGREYYGDDIDRIELERFLPALDALKRRDAGIEINTSQYKRGLQAFHPRKEILELAIRSGVRIASVGSDSHRPEQLGIGLKEAYSFLETMNVEPVFPRCHA